MDLCICKICLTREGRLYSMTKYDLYALYENLIGFQVDADTRLPQWVCAECGLRLISYDKLRQKSLNSHQLRQDMTDGAEYDPADFLTIIDLEAMKLKTTFTKTETDVFNYEPDLSVDKSKEIDAVNTIDVPLVDTEDDEVSNAETESNYQVEYLQFSDDLDSELANEEAKQQLDNGDEIEKILRDNLFNPLSCEDYQNTQNSDVTVTITSESFVNYQYGNITNVSDLNNEVVDESEFQNISIDYDNKYGLRSEISKPSFSSESDLPLNMLPKTDSLQYNCSQCDFTTSVGSIALSHSGKHVGKKHRCPHCDKEFSHRTSCSNHIRTKHPSAGDSICNMCGYSFINERGLQHHKRQRHGSHDQYIPLEGPTCSECNITFASMEAYTMHLKLSIKHDHAKKNGMMSKECHENRVAAKNPITCEQCGVKCETARAYHKHFMAEHPDKTRTRYLFLVPTMCEICGRRFHNSTYLKEHLVVHKTGVNPYKCNVCSKTFALKLHLQMHKKTHDGNRPLHPCQLCDKLFANKHNLNKHVLIHTGEKPFECQACYKRFPTKDRMKCHYQYVHEKKPWPKRNRNRRKTGGARETNIIYPTVGGLASSH